MSASRSFELTAPSNTWSLATRDVVEGVLHWQLWLTMAWHDIRMRYRRSVLGPLWLTVSMGVSVGFLGGLYGALLKMDLHTYVPFLALGLVIWGYMQSVITDGCTVFIQSEHFVKQVRLPLTTFAFRVVCKNVITMGHTAIVYLIVAIIFQVNPGVSGLLVVPALLLLVANSVWVVLLLGVLCTRFRDVPNIVQSLLQVVFFVTPILWTPQLLGRRAYLVDLNPVHHFVELVRSPLLGEVPALLTWEVVGAFTVGGFVLTYLLFARYRNRIAFWL